MGDLTHGWVLTALVVGCAALVVAGVVAGWRRRARVRAARHQAELAGSRAQVDVLTRRVEELAGKVDRVQRAAERQREAQREFVITSLAEVEPAIAGRDLTVERDLAPAPAADRAPRATVTRAVEDQLVETLARQRRHPGWRASAVDVAVRALALGHGLGRALSPDVLDRAAAEAHVARRRSRRERRRELRQAQRLVRAVKTGRVTARDVA